MITELHYPDDITKEEFSQRKVIFLAITGQSISEKNTDFYEGVKNGDTKYDEQVKCMITLPLNGSLSDQQQHSWSQMSYKSIIEKDFELVSSQLGGAGAETFKSIVGLTSSIMDDKSGNLGMITNMLGTRKPMLNPGYFQNYTGSSLRSFSFDFTFIPESKKETEQVLKIIQAFKIYSSPSKGIDPNTVNAIMGTAGTVLENIGLGGSSFLGDTLADLDLGNKTKGFTESFIMMSPFVWQIYVSNGIVNKLISLHTCVCNAINLTYGDDKFSMYEDGMPKEIKITLNFSECDLQFANNYETDIQVINNVSQTNTETETIEKKEEKQEIKETATSKIPSYIQRYSEIERDSYEETKQVRNETEPYIPDHILRYSGRY